STAMVAAISCTARPMCWHQPQITLPVTAGNAARIGNQAAPILPPSSNGTKVRSTPRRLRNSRVNLRIRLEGGIWNEYKFILHACKLCMVADSPKRAHGEKHLSF